MFAQAFDQYFLIYVDLLLAPSKLQLVIHLLLGEFDSLAGWLE